MRHHSIASSLVLAAGHLLLPATLWAQAFTSPRGLDTIEGNGSHGYVLGSTNGLRWQQIDATLHGGGFANIRSIAFRRDGLLATNAAYGARVFQQMSVVLAHGRASAVSKDQNANYVDAPVVVFDPRDVNAPDWSQQPATAPAPFDLQLLFDRVWTYNGTDDLLWEVRVQGVSPAPSGVVNYPYDFQPSTGAIATQANGTSIGTGCLASGQTQRFVLSATLFDHASKFRLQHSANFGPRNGVVVTFIDFSDPNLAVPGLCAPLHAMATLFDTMGLASAGGSVPSAFLDLPFIPAAIGGSLYLQAIALDPGQAGIQIAVSQGRRVVVPGVPAAANVVRAFSHANPAGQPFTALATGGVVARFEY